MKKVLLALACACWVLSGCQESSLDGQVNGSPASDNSIHTGGQAEQAFPHEDAYSEAEAKGYHDNVKHEGKATGDNVLINQRSCSLSTGSALIRAQNMTSTQLSSNCTKLQAASNSWFSRFNNPGPVANDTNTFLDVAVFDSSSEYQRLSGGIFGNATNNGGIYLEGNPASTSDEPARFIAYETSTPGIVWNLEHEFSHYLDGRYNMHGGFCDYPVALSGCGNQYSIPAIWWIEGQAEYNAYGNNNSGAISVAGNKTYSLSTLFRTTYSNSSSQIYTWGYLAVRYMFEKRRSVIDSQILPAFRSGNYNSYVSAINNIGTSYNTDFNAWLDCLANSNNCGGGSSTTVLQNGVSKTVAGGQGSQTMYYLDVPSNASNLQFRISGGSGDADMYVRFGSQPTTSTYDCRPYLSGNNETCSISNAQAGRYYVMLVGYSTYSGASLVGSYSTGSTPLPPSGSVPNVCSSQSAYSGNSLQDNVAVCVRSSSQSNGIQYYYISVPSGASQLVIKTAHGSGNGTLYYNGSTWATSSNYTQVSSNSGNTESITVNNPGSGYRFISVGGSQSGMSLLVDVQ